MMKTLLYTAVAALVLTFCLGTEVHAGTFKEDWYMSRGKANMKIRNYKAAIEAFEKLVEINPDNREAMRLLGRAYESQGLTDKAIEQYDRYLAHFPEDADIAFKQARYIEGARFSYRKNDAIRYYRMGLKADPHSDENRHRLAKLLAADRKTTDEALDEYAILIKHKPRDARLRAEYARLLGSRIETIDQAIEQYQILLDQNTRNSDAHRELAAAYAWRGDNDRAIYHSRLALRYDSQDRAAARIKTDLMQGREPRINAGLTYLSQQGNDSHYNYSGILLKGGGRADITPFVTGEADIGLEQYRNAGTDVDGTSYRLRLQGRFDPKRRVDAEWIYHDFKQTDADAEYLVQYSTQSGSFLITPGLRREFKYDSLLSLGGATDAVSQRKIGSARSNTAFVKVSFQDERVYASAMPYFGFVSADSTGRNSLAGADADARYRFPDDGTFAYSVFYKFQIQHYAEDDSGFVDSTTAPFAGGYFSPDLFVNNILRLEVSHQFRPDNELRLSAGPSVQYTRRHSTGSAWNMGADLDLTYDVKLSPSLYLTADGSYNQIADVYRRYLLSALIVYGF